MAFFQNNPSPQGEGEGTATPHSAKSRPLFKQDAPLPDSLSGQHISLSAYISQHLREKGDSPAKAEEPLPKRAFIPAEPVESPWVNRQAGQYLNSLDVEMGSALEQYLPTPMFRLRIMKKRLDDEMKELRGRLNKYRRLPEQSLAWQERLHAMEARLATLEAHDAQISRELSTLNTFGPSLYSLFRIHQSWNRQMNQVGQTLHKTFFRLIYGPSYQTVKNCGEEMIALRELYGERSHDPSASDVEISQILNRFEQLSHRAQTESRQIKPFSFMGRVWQEFKRLVE